MSNDQNGGAYGAGSPDDLRELAAKLGWLGDNTSDSYRADLHRAAQIIADLSKAPAYAADRQHEEPWVEEMLAQARWRGGDEGYAIREAVAHVLYRMRTRDDAKYLELAGERSTPASKAGRPLDDVLERFENLRKMVENAQPKEYQLLALNNLERALRRAPASKTAPKRTFQEMWQEIHNASRFHLGKSAEIDRFLEELSVILRGAPANATGGER
jgi:hypothetical protein